VFSILVSKDAIHPSSRLSYGDLLYGLPNTLVAVEAVLLSALFWYAFSAVEYSSKAHPETAFNFFRALGHSLNPMDLILGVARAIQLALGSNPGSSSRRYYGDADTRYKYASGEVVSPPRNNYEEFMYEEGYARSELPVKTRDNE
jgi:hypothetical protein